MLMSSNVVINIWSGLLVVFLGLLPLPRGLLLGDRVGDTLSFGLLLLDNILSLGDTALIVGLLPSVTVLKEHTVHAHP